MKSKTAFGEDFDMHTKEDWPTGAKARADRPAKAMDRRASLKPVRSSGPNIHCGDNPNPAAPRVGKGMSSGLQVGEIAGEEEPCVPVIDAHLHFVTFTQTTPGIAELQRSLDSSSVTECVFFGLPMKKKWQHPDPLKPTYYLDNDSRCYYWPSTDEIVAHEYMKLSEEERKRFAPMLCGLNPTDLSCIDYVEYMFEKYPFWRGIGELQLRHDDLSHLIVDEPARANHPALDPVYSFCEKRNLPILLHQNSTSVGIHDKYVYLHEMREPLENHPDAIFMWAHCGCSRRVVHKHYHRMIVEMLREHPNLYLDLSWVVYDLIICTPQTSLDEPLIPKEEWLDKVIVPYADRIVIGSDLVGTFDGHSAKMARYNGLLERVPEEVRTKIARSNAKRLWFS